MLLLLLLLLLLFSVAVVIVIFIENADCVNQPRLAGPQPTVPHATGAAARNTCHGGGEAQEEPAKAPRRWSRSLLG